MKKEISDHIAKTFFEKKKPSRKKEKKAIPRRLWALLVVMISLAAVAGFKVMRFQGIDVLKVDSNLALIKHDGPYRLSYDFSGSAGSKVETLTLEMPEIDLRGYRKLRFSLRLLGEDSPRDGTIKVSLINTRKETSSLYVQSVGRSWTRIDIPCGNFQSISDWSNLRQLAFTVEEWNLRPKKGVLFIDAIEFVK
ncbi:MAG: hypothetical protein WC732_06500 [Candidatus Omnitrophota bacterium]